MAEPIRPKCRQPVVTVEQDAVGIGRLILDPRFVEIWGKSDVGMGNMSECGFEVLLAVPSDIGQGRRCLTQAAEDVDLPVWAGICHAGKGGDI